MEVRGSAFWPAPFAGDVTQLAPVGDGVHAWVLEQGRVSLIDKEGRRVAWSGSGVAAGVEATRVILTDQPGRAWLMARATTSVESPLMGDRVYLLEANPRHAGGGLVLEADQVLYVLEQPGEAPLDVRPELQAIQDVGAEVHARLWGVVRRQGTSSLFTLDAQGKVTPLVSLSALGSPSERELVEWRVVPVKGQPQAWLKAGGRLFFIDAQATPPVRGPLLGAERVQWVEPAAEGARAWVMADVRAREGGTRRQLFLVDAAAPAGAPPTLLLEGEEVRQLAPGKGRTHVWVAGAVGRGAGPGGGVLRVGLDGKPRRVGGPSLRGQAVLLTALRSGRVWALTGQGGAYLLEEDGAVLAGRERVLSLASTGAGSLDELLPFRVHADEHLALWGSEALLLKAEAGSVKALPLLGGAEAVLDVMPDGRTLWVQPLEDRDLYAVSLRQERFLEVHRVLRSRSGVSVFPAGEGRYGWIAARPASMAYVPLARVGATLALRGGGVRVEPGGQVVLQGPLPLHASLRGNAPDSVDLDWPGREGASRFGGVLEVTVQEADGPRRLVASALRRYAPGAPPPRLDWHLKDLSLGTRPYTVVFRYHDEVGTDSRLVLHGVPFSASLLEQVWFRTAVAFLVASLLFVVPLVALRRKPLARRWLPFIGWSVNVLGGSGLAVAGVAHGLRIHFPAFVGMLFAEMLLCMVAGAFSPAAFRLLAATRPFVWLVPLALGLPATRRRILAEYVEHVGRKLEAWRRQANDERYVALPVDFHEGGALRAPFAPPPASSVFVDPEERLARFLTQGEGGHVLIESPGGRGKSALLRAVVGRMLARFEQNPSSLLPVLCDTRSGTLEEAVFRALESYPLPRETQEVLLMHGNYVVVMDGLTESALGPEALQDFIEGRYGAAARLLLTSRPHLGFRQAVEGSRRWMLAEPRRLDEQALDRFISAYAPGQHEPWGGDLRRACQGADGMYLPILVRLALLSDEGSGGGIAALYEAAFHGLLRQRGQVRAGADEDLLLWAEGFCVETYWTNGIRSLRYRNAPQRERMRELLRAGVLVSEEPNLKPGQDPSQVRFFHDSMQSYLTARGLFAREHARPTWDFLWRAAADPLFTSAQSELVSGAGSELFQMCLQVFGPEERLRRELRRQLLEWAHRHDDDLRKRDIADAVPESLRPRLLAMLSSHDELSPRSVLQAAVEACSNDLSSMGALYMRLANLLWSLERPRQLEEDDLGERDSFPVEEPWAPPP